MRWCLFTLFAFLSFESSCLGDIPTACSENFDIRKLPWLLIFHAPQCLTIDFKGEHVFRPLSILAYFHSTPFIDGRLRGPKQPPHVGSPVQSGCKVDSARPVDPQGRCSVPDVSTLATDRHVQHLRVTSLQVAAWSELKGDSPFFGQGGKGGQKASSFQ